MLNIKTTPEQEAFINALLEKKPVFLSARAGTGKTTTIRLGVEALLEKGSINPRDICAVAFNKSNQEDLTKALPTDCKVATLHSLGYQTLRSFLPRIELKSDKLFELTRAEGFKGKNARDTFAATMKLVSAAKNWGLVPNQGGFFKKSLVENSPKTWLQLQEYFELWDADLEKARSILLKSNEDAIKKREIDFDDMVYLPVAFDLKLFSAEFLIVDEAQDLSPLNLELLRTSPAKIWYVGDPYQTIYSWRGASADVVESLGLDVLPLTNCWRCSGNIIREARQLVADIKTENPDGEGVKKLEFLPEFSKRNPATILGRRNADLVRLALKMRRENLRICILGRDFTKMLTGILAKLKGTTSKQLRESLSEWARKMSDAYPHQSSEINDYAGSLNAILSECSGAREAEKLINLLFTDKPTDDSWILSTIHRVKGKEFKEVYILDWTGKNLNQPWQRKEDRNLRYVAITRAKERLYIIEESAWNESRAAAIEKTLAGNSGVIFSEDGELLSGGESGGGLWD